MDAPFLVRCDEIEHELGIAVILLADNCAHRLGIYWRPIDTETFAERPHPGMILVELLAAGERAPGDQLMHVRPPGVIGELLGFDARPGRRRDDLARLGDEVAETNALVLAVKRQMFVLSTRDLAQFLPGLHCDSAICLWGEHQDRFRRLDVSLDTRHP